MAKTRQIEVVEWWQIYHQDLDDKPTINYFAKSTRIGPAFGATAEKSPLLTKRQAMMYLGMFPMICLAEIIHVGLVPPEDTTFRPWVGKGEPDEEVTKEHQVEHPT